MTRLGRGLYNSRWEFFFLLFLGELFERIYLLGIRFFFFFFPLSLSLSAFVEKK